MVGGGWWWENPKKPSKKPQKAQRASRYAIAREAQHDAWPELRRDRDRRRAVLASIRAARDWTCSRLTFRATRFSHALRRRSANGSQRWEWMLQQGERLTPRVRRPHRDWRLQPVCLVCVSSNESLIKSRQSLSCFYVAPQRLPWGCLRPPQPLTKPYVLTWTDSNLLFSFTHTKRVAARGHSGAATRKT